MEIVKKVIKQASWQVLGKIISSVTTLVVLGLIARSYGQEGLGIFTLTLAYLAFFNLTADLGLNAYILPKLKDNPKEASEILSFRIFWALILVILANFIAFLLPFQNPQFTLSVFFGSFSILGFAIFTTTNLIFQSKLRFDQSIFASSLEFLSHIPLTILFILNKFPISMFSAILTLGSIVNNLVALALVRKFYQFKISFPNFNYIFSTLRVAWPVSLTLILNSIYFRVDTFILSSFHSFAVVGNYNLAYQIFQNALILPTFIMNGFYPLMLKTLEEDKFKFLKQIRIAGVILLSIALVGTLLTFLLADLVITILAGKGLNEAAISLKILSLGFPAYFLSSLLMWVYLSLKRYKSMAAVYALGLTINFLLNLLFIPKYSYIAASLITGISEYLILLLLVVILYFDSKRFFDFRKKI